MASHTRVYSLRFLAFLVIPSILILSCIQRPLSPVAPNWDIQFSIPLVDTVRTVMEIVRRDTSILQYDPVDNLIYYNFREFIGTDTVGNRMKMFPDSMRFRVTIGALRIDDFQSQQNIQVLPDSTYPSIPPMTISSPSVLTGSGGAFQSLTFETGTAQLTITNNLPIAISFANPILVTDGMGDTVASFLIPGQIAANGGSASDSSDLAGRSVDSTIRVSSAPTLDSISISTPGSTTPITIDSTNRLRVELRFTNITVSSATANIPPQRVFSRDSALFVADDSTLVDSAFFKSGTFSIEMKNWLDLTVTARLRLPNLQYVINNRVFDTSVVLLPQQTVLVPVNIAQFKAASLTGNPTNLFWYTAQLDSVHGNPGTVSRDDSMTAVVIPGTELIVRSARIVIEPTALDVDTTYRLRLGNLPGNFSLDSIYLPKAAFLMDSLRTPVEAQIDTPLFARVKDTLGLINVDTVRYRGSPFLFQPPVSQGRLRVDSTNSNIIQVISQFVAQQPPGAKRLPDSVHVKGSATLNPGYSLIPRIIADTTRIKGRFDVEFPLNIGLRNGIYSDSASIAGKVGIEQSDIDRFKSGRLTIDVGNSLPASLKLDLKLRVNDSTVVDIPRVITDSIFVPAAGIGTDGFSNQTARRLISLNLDRDDVRNLARAEFLLFKVRVNAASPGARQSAKFRTTDSVRLRISGTLIFHVAF